MATYKQIQEFVRSKYGRSVKSCHIAHVKHMNGFAMKQAPNRISPESRVYECPEKFIPWIEDALIHFGMLNKK
jgi:hypothetical protein